MFYVIAAKVSTNIQLPNGNIFAVGGDLVIQCEVGGYPQPIVTWTKDEVELQPSERIQITGNICLLFFFSKQFQTSIGALNKLKP